MAQASSAQREPSMEEILASIRRIIEDNDAAGRRPAGEPEQARVAPSAERTVIEVDAFRNELRAQPAEPARSTPAAPEAPRQKPTLADIQAQITAEAAAMPKRWAELAPEKPAPAEASAMERRAYERSPDDIKKAIENSRAAREDARALLGIPEPANSARPSDAPPASQPSPAREPEVDRHAEVPSVSRAAAIESAAP